MTRTRNIFRLLVATAIVVATNSACSTDTVYHHFERTPLAGWEKVDTLFFTIPPLADPGHYSQQVDIRTSEAYPFTSLTIVIDQRIFPGNRRRHQVLKCPLQDDGNLLRSRGISQYKYSFALPDIDLRRGDSLSICIRHDMKREILPGITDIGLRLTHQY